MSAEMNPKDVSRILDMTDSGMAAFYPDDAERRFYFVGQGNYPNRQAGFSFAFSRAWKKVKSETGNRYWYSKGNKLGLALGKNLALVSDTDPFFSNRALSSDGTLNPAPEAFEEFRRPCVLSGWLNNPGDTINRFIERIGIPITIPAEEFYFGAIKAPAEGGSGDFWELSFKVKAPSTAQARAFLSLFTLARLFMQRGTPEESGTLFMGPREAAALLFANVPQLDGAFLTFRTEPLETGAIALLFTMFSVYSN
jgi:hypothetical protein